MPSRRRYTKKRGDVPLEWDLLPKYARLAAAVEGKGDPDMFSETKANMWRWIARILEGEAPPARWRDREWVRMAQKCRHKDWKKLREIKVEEAKQERAKRRMTKETPEERKWRQQLIDAELLDPDVDPLADL